MCSVSVSHSEQACDQDGGPAYLCHRGLTEVTSPVRHLLNTPPLQANDAPLDPPVRDLMTVSTLPAQYFFLHPSASDWFKIMVVLLSVSPA